MRVVAGVRGFLAVVVAAASLGVGASAARASTGDIIAPQSNPPQPTDGWQAGTCTTDSPECTVDTTAQFFKQSAGHPQVGFTQFIVKHTDGPLPGEETPVGDLKTIRVDLPVGLSVNPQATPQCPLSVFEAGPSSCPAGSDVGTSLVTPSVDGVPSPTPISATVYNIDPPNGEPARFGFNLAGNNVYLRADVAWDGDYHEGFTIDVPPNPLGGLPTGGLILKNRLVFDGRAGDGTFITTPSTCYDPAQPGFEHVYSTYLLASSVAEESDPNYRFPQDAFPAFESPIPQGQMPIGCDQVNLEGSSVGVDPNTTQTDSPAGASVNVDVPFVTGGGNVAKSNLKDATVTLPPGMGLNPAAANGLEACTDAEFGKGTRNPVACPAASQIGTVSIQTPPLPPDSLAGNVYLGQPLSSDPASGQEYRIFVDAESARYGISVRLVGNVSADPQTGRLTTTFADNPQVPFSSFQLHLNGGTEGAADQPADLWSQHDDDDAGAMVRRTRRVTPSASFDLTAAPDGGPCAKTLAERPFAPSFAAASADKQGGAFTDFTVNLARPDGAQELKRVDVDLPPGLVAKLAGVSYCPEADIAAAAANSGGGREEPSRAVPTRASSAPPASTPAPAPSPSTSKARVYLAGPYKGAPVSLVFITPAVAGPFDLGAVVVRVALSLDPDTAQVHAVSDPIPDVFGGVKLDLRSIAVDVSRKQFTLNPTNCDPMAVGGTLFGGGADPTSPAAFFPYSVSAPFQATGCDSLPFGPTLYLRLFGRANDFRRNGHPKLRAVLLARTGDANIGRAAVTIPKSIQLDQGHIRTVCTRDQLAAGACPADSIYGHATAFTPLLDQPLSGPVYLVPEGNVLPDLVAALHGQVDVNLRGRTDTTPKGQLRSTFDAVPDVPVSKFVLSMQGGGKGLLVPNQSLCVKPFKAVAKISAQNGKTANQRPKLRVPCGLHGRSQRKHH